MRGKAASSTAFRIRDGRVRVSGLARQTRHRNSSDELQLLLRDETETDKGAARGTLLGATF